MEAEVIVMHLTVAGISVPRRYEVGPDPRRYEVGPDPGRCEVGPDPGRCADLTDPCGHMTFTVEFEM